MLDRVCLCRGGMRTSMIVVVLVTHALALAGSRRDLPRRPRPQPLSVGGISGKVLDSGGRPVAGAAVLVQTQATGIPLERGSGLPAIYRGIRLGPGEYLSVLTDAEGRLVFEKIPVGSYRVVAQSWRNKTSLKGLGEVEGEEIELRGVANEVVVTSRRLWTWKSSFPAGARPPSARSWPAWDISGCKIRWPVGRGANLLPSLLRPDRPSRSRRCRPVSCSV